MVPKCGVRAKAVELTHLWKDMDWMCRQGRITDLKRHNKAVLREVLSIFSDQEVLDGYKLPIALPRVIPLPDSPVRASGGSRASGSTEVLSTE